MHDENIPALSSKVRWVHVKNDTDMPIFFKIDRHGRRCKLKEPTNMANDSVSHSLKKGQGVGQKKGTFDA